ncbi:MAG: hypothetical protein ACTS4X_01700 [Candidatus Hodgkinia cicadicola]
MNTSSRRGLYEWNVIIIIYSRKRNPMYVRKWNLPPTKTYIGVFE